MISNQHDSKPTIRNQSKTYVRNQSQHTKIGATIDDDHHEDVT